MERRCGSSSATAMSIMAWSGIALPSIVTTTVEKGLKKSLLNRKMDTMACEENVSSQNNLFCANDDDVNSQLQYFHSSAIVIQQTPENTSQPTTPTLHSKQHPPAATTYSSSHNISYTTSPSSPPHRPIYNKHVQLLPSAPHIPKTPHEQLLPPLAINLHNFSFPPPLLITS
jgi:hypothetical protein